MLYYQIKKNTYKLQYNIKTKNWYVMYFEINTI